jgi:hypothetical protein
LAAVVVGELKADMVAQAAVAAVAGPVFVISLHPLSPVRLLLLEGLAEQEEQTLPQPVVQEALHLSAHLFLLLVAAVA